MDEFDFQGDELKHTLKEIEQINNRLGGNQVTLSGIQRLMKSNPKSSYTIIDIGCGSGGFLKNLAIWAKKKRISVNLIGVDANPHTIEWAQDLAEKENAAISFQVMDVFSEYFNQIEADIVTCNLTLHHFDDMKILHLLQQISRNAHIGVVINDLHRSKLAYRLFQAYAVLFMKSKIAKHDGLISILRGFRKNELVDFSHQLGTTYSYYLQWKWAFRWLWIIEQKH